MDKEIFLRDTANWKKDIEKETLKNSIRLFFGS
jgi:hypothetical protein